MSYSKAVRSSTHSRHHAIRMTHCSRVLLCATISCSTHLCCTNTVWSIWPFRHRHTRQKFQGMREKPSQHWRRRWSQSNILMHRYERGVAGSSRPQYSPGSNADVMSCIGWVHHETRVVKWFCLVLWRHQTLSQHGFRNPKNSLQWDRLRISLMLYLNVNCMYSGGSELRSEGLRRLASTITLNVQLGGSTCLWGRT